MKTAVTSTLLDGFDQGGPGTTLFQVAQVAVDAKASKVADLI